MFGLKPKEILLIPSHEINLVAIGGIAKWITLVYKLGV